MDENMVDVLIYLYETYGNGESRSPSDQNALEDELIQAGFTPTEIRQALQRLDGLVEGFDTSQYHPPTGGSMRVYNELECVKLDREAHGLLLFLEQNGVLDPVSRELVVDRLLAIDHPDVSPNDIKWVVLLVLMNRPGREAGLSMDGKYGLQRQAFFPVPLTASGFFGRP